MARSKSGKGENSEEFEKYLAEFKSKCEQGRTSVIEAGGLHILGTERHESRRIDNQLRGRSGRQGDPGSSRFCVSLEDDLMRIFGGDRVKMIMERVGMQDGEPIEHKYTSKAIENAQKKVEAHNFEIRKHLIDFDDVMNKQREVVYSQRKFILAGSDLKTTAFEMIEDVADETIRRFTNEKTHFEDWDITALSELLYGQFGIRFDFMALPEAEQTEVGLVDHVIERVKDQYEKKEAEISSPIMRELEKFIMLQAVDSQWKDHLLSMDHLKEGIGLRGYGQRDPLKEYQKEGYDLFLDMSFRIKEETARNLLLVKLAMPNEIEEMNESRERELQSVHANLTGSDAAVEPQRRTVQKIGRNAPCPCGSGKKYKKCCGKAQ